LEPPGAANAPTSLQDPEFKLAILGRWLTSLTVRLPDAPLNKHNMDVPGKKMSLLHRFDILRRNCAPIMTFKSL
jgi:hypothetical protein